MEKVKEAEPKRKGLFAILKESMVRTSEGCGPGCGCHVEEDRTKEQGGDVTKESTKK
jgi:hypothetical protein